MTRCVGIRGATTVDDDTLDEVLAATQTLLQTLRDLNGFEPDDLASIFFTTTPDIRSTFPARAARRLGWTQVPMLCAREISAPSSVARCVRVLIHWNTDTPSADVRHAYLHDSRLLRPDWAIPPVGDGDAITPAPEDPEAIAVSVPPIAAPEPPPATPLRLEPMALLGGQGSYSHEAAALAFQVQKLAPRSSFQEVFAAVSSGVAPAALVPIENSTTGSIYKVYDLLQQHEVGVVGELVLPVRHALLAPQGATLATIEEVTSHPQALSQCENWIRSHRWRAIAAHNTAEAAATVAERGDVTVSAIASRVAGSALGLTVLADGIQDLAENYTRFWLLTPRHAAANHVAPGFPADARHKTSILFATDHTAGNLYACLAEFAVRDVNLTRIESRPDKRTPWNYLFYVDVDGSAASPPVQAALAAVQGHASYLRVLGTYPTRLV